MSTGTGKTDTAVQIMHVLYANNPGQRILLITHSNQALNDLFGKLMQVGLYCPCRLALLPAVLTVPRTRTWAQQCWARRAEGTLGERSLY